MKNRIKAWLPTPDTVRQNRWLRWMGPILNHPRLWHFSRKGIALGMALGVFFGLLIPIAQIPFSATLAVLLRANVPMAVASTLVTNPVTFGPVYYGAYHLGEWVLGQEAAGIPEALKPMETSTEVVDRTWGESLSHWFEQITTVGKPLAVGLVILACVFGVLVYGLVSLLWVLKTRWSRRQRIRQRTAAKTKS
ncbi:MAG: DUF2062 domain-containing protein [Hydrogenophaga sp.]|jgi:uncharacterized protein|nr:DUF2062 domain-containing protein [Hydrogenophaga sp.]